MAIISVFLPGVVLLVVIAAAIAAIVFLTWDLDPHRHHIWH
jgi:hypothetical protein